MKKVILLVTNKLYLEKSLKTIESILKVGNYREDIVLITGDDLKNETIFFDYEKLIVKYFPDFDRKEIIKILKQKPIGDGRTINKTFQWHKIHCFDSYFKNWDVCFYIDAGMYIFNDINCFFNLDWKNSFIAHSDSYPNFEWKLSTQFDNEKFPLLYEDLKNEYNLNLDYFQSGIMLYDTILIDQYTKSEIYEISLKYINSKTNEQGILNLYFNSEKNFWKPLPTNNNNGKFYYDYWERNKFKHSDYCMLKYPKTI